MKILLIKNNRLYSYILPKEVKDNFWITDIDSFDNVRNLINVEARNGTWVLVSNYDTHIIDANKAYDNVIAIRTYSVISQCNTGGRGCLSCYGCVSIDGEFGF